MRLWTARSVIGRETLLAALVLALVMLNLGHVAPSVGNVPGYSADSSFCGDPIAPGDVHHAPCHACRIGSGADLPPKPACVEPVYFAAVPVLHVTGPVVLLQLAGVSPAQPRGPPALV